MTMDAKIRMIAGTFVLLSLTLGLVWTPWAFAFTAFVAVNLMQSSVTHWCPMEGMLKRVGLHKE